MPRSAHHALHKQCKEYNTSSKTHSLYNLTESITAVLPTQSWAEWLMPHPHGPRKTRALTQWWAPTDQPLDASFGFSQPLDWQLPPLSPWEVRSSACHSQWVMKLAEKGKHSLLASCWYPGVSKVGDRCYRLSCYTPTKSGESPSVKRSSVTQFFSDLTGQTLTKTTCSSLGKEEVASQANHCSWNGKTKKTRENKTKTQQKKKASVLCWIIHKIKQSQPYIRNY